MKTASAHMSAHAGIASKEWKQFRAGIGALMIGIAGSDRKGRRGAHQAAAAHPGEDEEIEEMHSAENQQHDADLCTEALEDGLEAGRAVARFEAKRHEADIDEIEADDEEVIDGI